MNISRELKQDFEQCSQLKFIFREISDPGVWAISFLPSEWYKIFCFKLWKKLLLFFAKYNKK